VFLVYTIFKMASPINIFECTLDDLKTLKNIGPQRAQAIIDGRENFLRKKRYDMFHLVALTTIPLEQWGTWVTEQVLSLDNMVYQDLSIDELQELGNLRKKGVELEEKLGRKELELLQLEDEKNRVESEKKDLLQQLGNRQSRPSSRGGSPSSLEVDKASEARCLGSPMPKYDPALIAAFYQHQGMPRPDPALAMLIESTLQKTLSNEMIPVQNQMELIKRYVESMRQDSHEMWLKNKEELSRAKGIRTDIEADYYKHHAFYDQLRGVPKDLDAGVSKGNPQVSGLTRDSSRHQLDRNASTAVLTKTSVPPGFPPKQAEPTPAPTKTSVPPGFPPRKSELPEPTSAPILHAPTKTPGSLPKKPEPADQDWIQRMVSNMNSHPSLSRPNVPVSMHPPGNFSERPTGQPTGYPLAASASVLRSPPRRAHFNMDDVEGTVQSMSLTNIYKSLNKDMQYTPPDPRSLGMTPLHSSSPKLGRVPKYSDTNPEQLPIPGGADQFTKSLRWGEKLAEPPLRSEGMDNAANSAHLRKSTAEIDGGWCEPHVNPQRQDGYRPVSSSHTKHTPGDSYSPDDYTQDRTVYLPIRDNQQYPDSRQTYMEPRIEGYPRQTQDSQTKATEYLDSRRTHDTQPRDTGYPGSYLEHVPQMPSLKVDGHVPRRPSEDYTAQMSYPRDGGRASPSRMKKAGKSHRKGRRHRYSDSSDSSDSPSSSSDSCSPASGDEFLDDLPRYSRSPEHRRHRDHYEPRRGSPPPPKLPIFTGNTEEWVSFLYSFEGIAQQYDWGERKKLTRLKECLRKNAIDFVMSRTKKEQNNYRRLIRCLKQRYGRTVDRYEQRQILVDMTQLKEESIEDYAERIYRTASQGFKGAGEKMIQQAAVEAFIRGGRDKLAVLMASQKRPKTIQQAVKKCKAGLAAQKAIWGRSVSLSSRHVSFTEDREPLQVRQVEGRDSTTARSSSPPPSLSRPASVIDSPSRKEFEDLKNLVAQILPKLERYQSPKGPVRCHKCKELGHIARNCNKRSRSPSPNPSDTRSSPDIKRDQCLYCLGFGHWAADCHKRLRDKESHGPSTGARSLNSQRVSPSARMSPPVPK
jgi:hypothetical protein